ncbi:MAG: DNA repair exonuclease [Bacteroidales bacterium]|nr:MAG: DNA repair exonuclease [Bacteroidales bacterium]
MTKVRFIHTADLHLDTPFKGLASWNKDLADKLKDATFKSFRKIVDLCHKENVDFLIISGDIFESENKSLAAQLKFISELKRLSDSGIHAYFVCGNHDPLNSWLDTTQLPENVNRFGSSKIEKFTYSKNKKPVADIHGISFQEKVVKDNLALKYKLANNPAPVSIAVLHGTTGMAGPHENYAPFKVANVLNRGFNYWALGHIHKRQIINESNPVIIYPGNPQGRDFGETGAKGCYLVEIDTNSKVNLTFVPVHIIRFEEIEVELKDEDKIDRLPEKIERSKNNIKDFDDNASYILRVKLTGRTSLHAHLNKPGEIDLLQEHFNEGQADQRNFTWIDRIELDISPVIDLSQIEKGNDFTAEIIKAFYEYEEDSNKVTELIKDIDEDLISYQIKNEINELTQYELKAVLQKAKWKLMDLLIREI